MNGYQAESVFGGHRPHRLIDAVGHFLAAVVGNEKRPDLSDVRPFSLNGGHWPIDWHAVFACALQAEEMRDDEAVMVN
jgi:hypothetical protein